VATVDLVDNGDNTMTATPSFDASADAYDIENSPDGLDPWTVDSSGTNVVADNPLGEGIGFAWRVVVHSGLFGDVVSNQVDNF